MKYNIRQISDIVKGELTLKGHNIDLTNIIFDTRKISFAKSSVFFAFTTQSNDGHRYIDRAYESGIRNFVVKDSHAFNQYEDANFTVVKNTLEALQLLAQFHRQQFEIPVIGITGSNGKTVLKEWLHKALSTKYKVIQSPNSYNSQIGVALSVLNINASHEIAIIEAGISQENEMENLEKMIKPTLGIFTNIGDAHNGGFINFEAKIKEKTKLFSNSKHVIYNNDNKLIFNGIKSINNGQTLSWGHQSATKIKLNSLVENNENSIVNITFEKQNIALQIPFTNKPFVELSMHLIACLLHFKFDENSINKALTKLDTLPNRLEIKKGENDCILINDSYSSDMTSMQLALEYQEQQSKHLSTAVIFSDFDQQVNKKSTYQELSTLFKQKKIDLLLAVGIEKNHEYLFADLNIKFFEKTENLETYLLANPVNQKCVLIKGARIYKFENIFDRLSYAVHQTTLVTNFSALENNLNIYKSKLKNSTKVMAVIKADAYGSGSIAVSEFLEQKGIDYLAVALIDEAIKIRKSGCSLPLMVFNIHNNSFRKLWEYNLEPEVYSIELFKTLSTFSISQNTILNIHLKMDTGMHRLGIEQDEIEELLEIIDNSNLHITSIFSHLSASENKNFDDFTHAQVSEFNDMYIRISSHLGYNPQRHILNTGGAIRFPEYQYDMVRLGLGLYGIDETQTVENELEKVHYLQAKVLQIKKLKKGESTGYSRSGSVEKETTIATVSLGYADGLMRSCGNGNYSVSINNQLCPTIGNVCMDVMMVDISHTSGIKMYDNVEIFGKKVHLEDLAKACGTISYEIISRIASRVKRVYTFD